VKTRDVRDLVRFDEAQARHETLFETDRVFSQVICLQRNQGLGPMGDPDADAVCLILAGEIAVQIGKGRGRMRQWETVLVPAGAELTVRNASDEPGVILLVTAPPPGVPGDAEPADAGSNED
jgi:glyoxylate utilization-related uncharacterized protein